MIDVHPKAHKKRLWRKCHCLKCLSQTRHEQDEHEPLRWKCSECGAAFTQNPWVTDSHPIIEEPAYDVEDQCQPNTNQSNALPVKEAASVTATTRLGPLPAIVPNVTQPKRARCVMAQASFL